MHRTGTLTAVGENLTTAAQLEVRKEGVHFAIGQRELEKGFQTSLCGRMSGGRGEQSYSSRVTGVEREGNEETDRLAGNSWFLEAL